MVDRVEIPEGFYIRDGVPGDGPVLTRIAYAAKAHWGYDPRTIDQWAGPLTVTEEYIRENPVFVMCAPSGEPVGFSSLLWDQGRWELDHMWVDPPCMGMGLGRRLFEHAVNQARLRGASWVWILSDPFAEGFYLHMGAERIGDWHTVVDGEDRIIPVMAYRMGASCGDPEVLNGGIQGR
ncbi:GNAT family N-acetyltransferase [Thermanaerovibrio velox]|uniref:GNAT family N-acetyltransferase n=1 Tax=Thermanaerovibrio velox TaxID=108007 RepID=UPI0012E9E6D7|nr:GNAT family N-acetyltransferase [Thermanaerovibrio velox]